MTDKLKRVKELSELYQRIQKMSKWADEDEWGYSKEKFDLLQKLTDQRMELLLEDTAETLVDLKELNNALNEQANLKWSSEPQRSLN